MQEQLITFETAKLAKEVGFNEFSEKVYLGEESEGKGALNIWEYVSGHIINKIYTDVYYKAPTQSLLQTWIREKYGLFVEVIVDKTSYPKFAVDVHIYTDTEVVWNTIRQDNWSLYNEYEEALEVGLMVALEYLWDLEQSLED